MTDPEHTQKQIDKYNKSKTPKDPYERGEKDRKDNTTIPDGDAQEMPADDWQNYVDGKMGRERRK